MAKFVQMKEAVGDHIALEPWPGMFILDRGRPGCKAGFSGRFERTGVEVGKVAR
jgi:hypothetical protein